ncbi:MAG: PAS domain S-box protein [Ignavibacteriales bacterium]|nr:PAS domain S-box protein [Ignavibacteriales bacterium]
MKPFLHRLRTFSLHLGLVEQAQMVASTAVVVIMVTIISANFFLNEVITWFDFISIITVGVIGFASVYFSLKYGRQLEEQRRELAALNAVAETVIRTIDLNYLLSNALMTVLQLAKTQYGWIYLVEGKSLVLKNSIGANFSIFREPMTAETEAFRWIQNVRTHKDLLGPLSAIVNPRLLEAGISSWISVPLRSGEQFAGVLLLAHTGANFFPEQQRDLISAFGNQISFALNNARLFERLAKSEQRYADLFDHSPDMYHVVNLDGIIVSCNETEARTLGYDKQALTGNHLFMLYPPEHEETVRHTLLAAFAKKMEIRGMEQQVRLRDGSLMDVSLNTSLVYDELGKPLLMRCAMRDITEKKKLELKIMQAQKIDSIGNLAGGVAHDFNNILASILGSASIMRRRMKPTDKWYPFVDIIETAAKRGASLTRQLLTFARRSNVAVHPVDLHEIIDETLHLFERSINSSIAITKNFGAPAALVSGDEGQIQQVLLNIFINARDAMVDGGHLTIETHVVSHGEIDGILSLGDVHEGLYVGVRVTDDGAGMERDVLQRMFEPFFTTKDQGKGTGLGLSVVYGVVKTHGGHISVQSKLKSGTTFSIYLPLMEGAQTIAPKGNAFRIVGGSESLLVVDDDESVCATIVAMLRDLGYTVQSARSGQAALDILAGKHRFDLIILDMKMPDMDGKKVFQKIRRMKIAARVLISSGYSDSLLHEKSFARKVDGFLQKPYQIEALAVQVRAVLDRLKTE